MFTTQIYLLKKEKLRKLKKGNLILCYDYFISGSRKKKFFIEIRQVFGKAFCRIRPAAYYVNIMIDILLF